MSITLRQLLAPRIVLGPIGIWLLHASAWYYTIAALRRNLIEKYMVAAQSDVSHFSDTELLR